MRQRIPTEVLFWRKVDVRGAEDCWPWTGRLDKERYGRMTVRDERNKAVPRIAHRMAYQFVVGEIPDGLSLDHLCHTRDDACAGGRTCVHRRCVNPRHLEPVTLVANVKRGVGPRRTHCINGHPFSEENTVMPPEGSTRGRRCKACDNARSTKYWRAHPELLLGQANSRKTHCPNGHSYSGENLFVDTGGRRRCRICEKSKRRARTEAAAAAKGKVSGRRRTAAEMALAKAGTS
jgi:hypothetical protein